MPFFNRCMPNLCQNIEHRIILVEFFLSVRPSNDFKTHMYLYTNTNFRRMKINKNGRKKYYVVLDMKLIREKKKNQIAY